MDTIVKRARPQTGINLSYIKLSTESVGDAGDQYTGLDRFGRVVDQRWIRSSDNANIDRYTYGYDADSNVLFKQNTANPSDSELYHADGATAGYDGLNRLTAFQRGRRKGAGHLSGKGLWRNDL